ncbi:MAG: hypothetical protein MI725_15995, partial [Pirellulales bacterium]|nr:hypothetical protein [Pirellulales bacterium]
ATWLGPMERDFTTIPPEMASNPEQRFGMVWVYNGNDTGPPSPEQLDRFNKDTRGDTSAPYGAIVSNVGSRFMRPASEHPEIFIAAFCDGGAKSISENIEYRVYQQLMTPNGAKAAVPGTANFLTGFMTPPLSDSDY